MKFQSKAIITAILISITYSVHCKISMTESDSKMNFWSTQVKGANVFNHEVDRELIIASKKYGIRFIRLSPDKFGSKQRDFLIGNADHYKGLVPEDLAHLKNILDICFDENMPVVLTMLSLPGSRWKQNNKNIDDLRIWIDPKFQDQAAQFWQDLAIALKDHPAIVGYNILNEPHPERVFDESSIEIHHIKQDTVQKKLFEFYNKVAESIRMVDKITPIIVDSSSYGDAQCFEKLQPIPFSNVLYSFHIYEPFIYTNLALNQGKYSYPGNITSATDKSKTEHWDRNKLKAYMDPVRKFQAKYNIPNNQILVGEFGGHRTSKGIHHYFKDLTGIFNEYAWHHAVYSFREDTWDGMDYELGNKKLGWSYWKAVEEGKTPKKTYEPQNQVFTVLKKEWQSQG